MSATNETALALMAWMADVAPLREMVMGYRAQLIADGISPDHADAMAADFHRYVFHILLAGLKK